MSGEAALFTDSCLPDRNSGPLRPYLLCLKPPGRLFARLQPP